MKIYIQELEVVFVDLQAKVLNRKSRDEFQTYVE